MQGLGVGVGPSVVGVGVGVGVTSLSHPHVIAQGFAKLPQLSYKAPPIHCQPVQQGPGTHPGGKVVGVGVGPAVVGGGVGSGPAQLGVVYESL